MGYILPITQYTYMNYHAREIKDKKSVHHIGATYKVMFHKIHDNERPPYNNLFNIAEKAEEKEGETTKSVHQMTRHERKDNYIIDKATKARLTGKGSWMNQQV